MRIILLVPILAVVVTQSFGVPVNQSGSTIFADSRGIVMLCQDGFPRELQHGVSSPGVWVPLYGVTEPIPLPLAELEEWWGYFFLTKTGEYWGWIQLDGEVGWFPVPPGPCDFPVDSKSESLGGLKSMFR